MSMNKREAAELERLKRENEVLRAAVGRLTPPGPTWYEVAPGVPVYIPMHTPVVFHGLAVRAEEAPGLIDLNGEDSIVVHPLASNHIKVLSPGRGFRGRKS